MQSVGSRRNKTNTKPGKCKYALNHDRNGLDSNHGPHNTDQKVLAFERTALVRLNVRVIPDLFFIYGALT